MTNWTVRERTLIGIAVAIGLAGVLTMFPGWPQIGAWLGKSDAPAWVQALGSVLAIVASVLLVQHQHRLEQLRALDAEQRARQAVHDAGFQLVGAVAQVANKAIEHSKGSGSRQWALRGLEIELAGLVDALGRVDLLRFDEHELIEGVLVARAVAQRLLDAVSTALEDAQRLFVPERGGLPVDYWPGIGKLAAEVVADLEPRLQRLAAMQ